MRPDADGSPRLGERVLFTGKELDEETGLYYFGARYYDPVRARWASADPADRSKPASPASFGLFQADIGYHEEHIDSGDYADPAKHVRYVIDAVLRPSYVNSQDALALREALGGATPPDALMVGTLAGYNAAPSKVFWHLFLGRDPDVLTTPGKLGRKPMYAEGILGNAAGMSAQYDLIWFFNSP